MWMATFVSRWLAKVIKGRSAQAVAPASTPTAMSSVSTPRTSTSVPHRRHDGPAGQSPVSPVRVSTAHWPLLAAVAGVTLAGLPTVNFQYGPDQALFAYIGRKLVQGDVLYVDWWDVKPPGVFWTYALVAWLPGGARTVRAFDLLVTLATVAAVYALGRLYWGRGAGAVAGFLYGLVYVTGSGYWNMAQPDSFMVLPLVLGVLAWERGRQTGSRGALLVAGVLFGVAYQYRPVVVLFPLVLVAWQALEGGWRRAVESALLLTAGALAVLGAVMLYLLLGGALGG